MKKNVTNEDLRLIGNEAQMSMKPSAMMMRAASACGSGSGCGSVSGCGCGSGSGCGCGCGSGSGCGSVSGCGCGSVSGCGCGSVSGCGSGTASDEKNHIHKDLIESYDGYKIKFDVVIAYSWNKDTYSANNILLSCNTSMPGEISIHGKKYSISSGGKYKEISSSGSSINTTIEFDLSLNVEGEEPRSIRVSVSISHDIGTEDMFVSVSMS